MKNLFFLSILSAIFLQSCYQETSPFIDNSSSDIDYSGDSYLDNNAMEYLIVVPGSYWIYRLDSLTTDTIRVDSVWRDTVAYMINRRTFAEEKTEVYMFSSYYGNAFIDSWSAKSIFVERTRIFNDSSILTEVVFTQPIQNNEYLKFVKFSEYPIYTTEFYDVMKVISEGNSRIYNSDSVIIENSTMIFYYARGIGLIKRYDPINEKDWLLEEYYIGE